MRVATDPDAQSRGVERGRLEAEAGSARKDLDDARRAKERMASRVAALYADGEDAKAEALEDALAQVREREGAWSGDSTRR